MIWIELVGPSGVGKSYWYNKLVQKHPEFHLKNSLVKSIICYLRSTGHADKRLRLLSFIANNKALSNSGLSVYAHNWLLNYGMEAFGKIRPGDSRELEALVALFLEDLGSIEDPMLRLKMANLYTRRLKEFVCCRSLAEKDQPVLFEDGIIHNNHGICNQNFLKVETALPAKLIFLKADLEYIYRNRKRRIARGLGTFKEKDMSDEELLKETERMCSMYGRKIENLEQRGVSIREVDVTGKKKKVISKMYSAIVN